MNNFCCHFSNCKWPNYFYSVCKPTLISCREVTDFPSYCLGGKSLTKSMVHYMAQYCKLVSSTHFYQKKQLKTKKNFKNM